MTGRELAYVVGLGAAGFMLFLVALGVLMVVFP